MSQGKLIALDETRNLIKKLTCRRVELTMENQWNGKVKADDVRIEGNTIHLSLSHQQSLGECIKHIGIPLEQIKDISINEGDLEEAFIKSLHQEVNHNGNKC